MIFTSIFWNKLSEKRLLDEITQKMTKKYLQNERPESELGFSIDWIQFDVK